MFRGRTLRVAWMFHDVHYQWWHCTQNTLQDGWDFTQDLRFNTFDLFIYLLTYLLVFQTPFLFRCIIVKVMINCPTIGKMKWKFQWTIMEEVKVTWGEGYGVCAWWWMVTFPIIVAYDKWFYHHWESSSEGNCVS